MLDAEIFRFISGPMYVSTMFQSFSRTRSYDLAQTVALPLPFKFTAASSSLKSSCSCNGAEVYRLLILASAVSCCWSAGLPAKIQNNCHRIAAPNFQLIFVHLLMWHMSDKKMNRKRTEQKSSFMATINK